MNDRPRSPRPTHRRRAAASVVLLAALAAFAGCSSAPDTFIGPMPEEHRGVTCYSNPHGGGGCVRDDDSADLYWAVAPATTFTTRISRTEHGQTAAEPFDEISGYLELTNTDECDAQLSWSITPDPKADRAPSVPPLTTAEQESPSLDDYPVPAQTQEIRITFRRLDRNPCWAHVSWQEASID